MPAINGPSKGMDGAGRRRIDRWAQEEPIQLHSDSTKAEQKLPTGTMRAEKKQKKCRDLLHERHAGLATEMATETNHRKDLPRTSKLFQPIPYRLRAECDR